MLSEKLNSVFTVKVISLVEKKESLTITTLNRLGGLIEMN